MNAEAGGNRKSKKRVSLGVVDDKFVAAYQAPQQRQQGGGVSKEVSLSQARSKALARLGATDGNSAFQQPTGGGGRNGKKRRTPILPLKFNDPEVEVEYSLTAYIMHRPFLAWFMLLFALTYTVVCVATLSYDLRHSNEMGSPSMGAIAAAAALRATAAASALLVAILVLSDRLSLKGAQVWTAIAALLLWASPLAATHLRKDMRECPELLLLYLACYAVLCPGFRIRYTAGLCISLGCLQGLSLAATVPLQTDESTRGATLITGLREFLKAIVLNVMGVWLARRSERSNRETFVNAKLFQEELLLRKAVCSDVQRLLLNTLPEPIVREIAAGTSRVAHRYENVTVLQADMVGFTPLSAARGPEEVLGILSELFAEFDQAATRWGVHKVKTIGDAYIVCCGAFYMTEQPDVAAVRVVNMALSMQQIVTATAASRGVDIGVRIGIHTGMVIGGIIGTVRFHFDMWGNGVGGAVRLEELGQRGRVHVSDCTEELVRGHFPLSLSIGDGQQPEAQRGLEEGFGVVRTFLVDETKMDMAPYMPHHNNVNHAPEPEKDFLHSNSEAEVELAIDEVIVRSSTEGGGGSASLAHAGESCLQRVGRILGLPSLYAQVRSRTRQGTRGGVGEVTNAIAFMKSLGEAADEDGPGGGGSASSVNHTSSNLFGVSGARVSFGGGAGKRARTSSGGSLPERQSGGKAPEDSMSFSREAAQHGTGTAGDRKGSVSLNKNFFVKKADRRHSLTADSGLITPANKEKNDAAQAEQMLSAKRFLTQQSEMRTFIVVVLGLYDFLCSYFGAVNAGRGGELAALLLTRYCGYVPLLLLTRSLIATGGEAAPSSQRILAFSVMLIVVPTAALVAGIAVIRDEVRPCPVPAGNAPPIQLCPMETAISAASFRPPPAPSSPPPLAPLVGGYETLSPAVCLLEPIGDAPVQGPGFCKMGWQSDYVQTLGMLSIICHYMLVYSRLGTVATCSAVCTVALLAWIIVAQLYFTYPDIGLTDSGAALSRYPDAAWRLRDFVVLALWWLLAHCVGLLHYRLRYLNLFQAQLLRKRHHRLLGSIREETEHCEQLLRNILPPHVLVHLSGLIAHADHAAKGHHQTPVKVIAERYHDCCFLFAKIGGLSRLVNDNSVDPHAMMNVLQRMFDRFDALADMFGVQKVRKTANEYYLVAAGLPNTKLLPSTEDRAIGIAGFGFAMINIMHIVNLELEQYGINFTCQVGIHTGSAIAGIIGHKTFQYDLCGDAVNTAARMCSYSKPGHVNISDAAYQLLKHKYGAVPRGEIEVKGKGKMHNYYLLNMPVEQQQGLAELAAAMDVSDTNTPVIDRWARKGENGSPKGQSPMRIADPASQGPPGSAQSVSQQVQGTASNASSPQKGDGSGSLRRIIPLTA
jgi:class 3 adenylate cyclase